MMNVPLPILGSYFVVRERSQLIAATGPQQLVGPDPRRWALQFFNNSAPSVVMFVFPDPAMGIAGGYQVQPGYTEWWFERHGAMVQLAWFCTINPVGNFAGCYEILYQPPAGVA